MTDFSFLSELSFYIIHAHCSFCSGSSVLSSTSEIADLSPNNRVHMNVYSQSSSKVK